MASFTNMATLSYNGNTVNSNIVTGELQEVLAVSKIAVTDTYTANDRVTYIVSLVNSGTFAFTGLTVTDTLGGYLVDTTTVYPLSYVTRSMRYYVGGVLQATPTVTAGPPLVITGLSVPAGSNAMLIYEAAVTEYAPLTVEGAIVNTVTVTGDGLSAPLTATETINTRDEARLVISKALSPAVVTENGQLTYTFTIQNLGNTAAVATDNAVLTDVFDPILNPITVTFNGVTWTESTNYTYNTTTGLFTTVAGQITVPAATYSQNPDGTWSVTPGVSTLVVTGTV